MNQQASKLRQRGVGMIDVLVAVLVIGLGAAGLARFQGALLREGGTAKARVIAAQLAREKLDDLRHFTTMTEPAGGGAGVFAFGEIGTNTGGVENSSDGSLVLPATTVTYSNVAYSRSWVATNYYYCNTGAAASTSNCSTPKSSPDYKLATVTISWDDPNGQSGGTSAQTLSLSTAIAAVDPLSGALGLLSAAGNTRPIAGYNAQALPVIAIDLGGSQKKETTNPSPEVITHGKQTENVIVHYSTIKYSTSNNTITREDFTTISCTCTEMGTASAPDYVNGPFNLKFAPTGKRYGQAANQFQAPECDVCCRDHHDDSSCDYSSSTGKSNCYDPWRAPSYYSTALHDHRHYDADGQTADDTGKDYVEACRLKRVDGYLRLVQDWHLVQLNAIPNQYFAPGGTTSAGAITDYGSYVKSYVGQLLGAGTASAKPWLDDRGDSRASVGKGSSSQMDARGIYLDYLDDATTTQYANRIAGNDATVYQEIPFYEVNMTQLAQWATSPNPSSIASITNDPVVSGNNYSRGLVSGTNYGLASVMAYATLGNSGIVSEQITADPQDGSEFSNATDGTIYITVQPTTGFLIGGAISPYVPGVTFTASDGGGPCTYNADGTYYCTTNASPWSGTITPSAMGYSFSSTFSSSSAGCTAICATGSSSCAYSSVTGNLCGQDYTASVVTTSHTITGTVSPSVNSVTLAASNGGSCSYTKSNGTYTCSVPGGWSGTVTPAASGYTFSPAQYSYSDLAGNMSGQDFAATAAANSFTISGSVIPSGISTTIIATDATTGATSSCTYNANRGSYSCGSLPAGWSGTVSASASGYAFTPTQYSYVGLNSDTANQNFTLLLTIAGTALKVDGTLISDSSVSFSTIDGSGSSGSFCGGYDSSTGAYACTVPYAWNGTITPSAANYTFNPAYRTYTNITGSTATERYTGTPTGSTTITISGTVSGLNKTTAISANTSNSGTCSVGPVSGSGSNKTATYSCSVTIVTGGSWTGTVTIKNTGPFGAKNASLTQTMVVSSGSNPTSYSAINSSRVTSYACSGDC